LRNIEGVIRGLRVVERLEKQVELIKGLVEELRAESSYRGIERLVQLTIQALLDLGLMAISALKGRKPGRYSEIGAVLHELGVLDSVHADLLKAMAGLRDILVHMYSRVDGEKVVEASKKLISDAPAIAMAVLEAVKTRGVDPQTHLEPKLEVVVSKLREVLRGRVALAYLFGGRVKGYALKGDYDIAVFMPENYTLLDLGLLQVDVARALGVDEELVDITCLNTAPPELVLEALSGIPVIEDPVLRLELEVKALRDMLDMRESLRLAGIQLEL